MLENPLTPGFGIVPDVLAGREPVLRDLRNAFDSARRSPYLTTLFVRARGTGKTVLLSCARDEAGKRGWVTASATALPGMLEELLKS